MSLRLRRKKRVENEDLDAWIVTYADLITQLMCFFVMILMVSEPKLDKLDDLKAALASGFVPKTIDTPFKAVFQQVSSSINKNQVAVDVAVDYSSRGVVLDFNTELLFPGQSNTLDAKAQTVLNDLIAAIKKEKLPKNYVVWVEGHTDDASAPQGSLSHWEVSSLRAAVVARYFAEHGIEPKKIRATGLAGFQPKVKNRDEHNNVIQANQKLNRRVVVRVEKL